MEFSAAHAGLALTSLMLMLTAYFKAARYFYKETQIKAEAGDPLYIVRERLMRMWAIAISSFGIGRFLERLPDKPTLRFVIVTLPLSCRQRVHLGDSKQPAHGLAQGIGPLRRAARVGLFARHADWLSRAAACGVSKYLCLASLHASTRYL